jgi:WXG100 family type VII secretion target
MAGQFQVDTGLMQTTAQGSANIADNMITQAKTLSAGIDFVRENWKGQAGDAFRGATHNQTTLLSQLIQKLQLVTDLVKQGGQGFDSHDASGSSKVEVQGQQFLNGSLNH